MSIRQRDDTKSEMYQIGFDDGYYGEEQMFEFPDYVIGYEDGYNHHLRQESLSILLEESS